MKRALNKHVLLLLMCVCLTVNAGRNTREYVYDYVDHERVVAGAAVVRPAPAAGKCAFSLGPAGGDSFVLLELAADDKYVIVNSSVWTLYLPTASPLPDKWEAGGNEFRHMGKEWVRVGRQEILAEKIAAFGRRGPIESTEIWVSNEYGVIAYRPMENPGRFILRHLPEKSFLSCR